MSDFNKPTISFSDQDVADAVIPDKLAEGWYLFVYKSAEASVHEKNGHLVINTTARPLEDPTDSASVSSLSIRDNIFLPFRNPDVPGHKRPNTLGLCQARLIAIDHSFPIPPRKIKGKQAFEFDGQEIDSAQADAERIKIGRRVMERLTDLWETPEELLECAFYGLVEHKDGYANINRWARELPADATLVAPENFKAPKGG